MSPTWERISDELRRFEEQQLRALRETHEAFRQRLTVLAMSEQDDVTVDVQTGLVDLHRGGGEHRTGAGRRAGVRGGVVREDFKHGIWLEPHPISMPGVEILNDGEAYIVSVWPDRAHSDDEIRNAMSAFVGRTLVWEGEWVEGLLEGDVVELCRKLVLA